MDRWMLNQEPIVNLFHRKGELCLRGRLLFGHATATTLADFHLTPLYRRPVSRNCSACVMEHTLASLEPETYRQPFSL